MHGFVSSLVLLDAHEFVFCYELPTGAAESKENKYVFLENQMSFPLADRNESFVSKEFLELSTSTQIPSEPLKVKLFSVVMIRMERVKLLPESLGKGRCCSF